METAGAGYRRDVLACGQGGRPQADIGNRYGGQAIGPGGSSHRPVTVSAAVVGECP